jgi:hypothetical protein
VYFDEASQQIPHNAITIEIAPHGLLQAILKRSLNEGITNVALTHRGHPDGTEFLLAALGKYVSGICMEIKTLRTAVIRHHSWFFVDCEGHSYNYLLCEFKSIFSFNVPNVFTCSMLHYSHFTL